MLDLAQLRSFVAVEQAGGFTLAAQRLGLGQSTVSQHIQRLEASLGRKLLARDTHGVSLTADGALLLGHARALLAMEGQVQGLFAARSLHGRLRFGVSEDFVTSRLPEILEDFVRLNPSVDLELTVALSGVLYEMQDAGEIDLVLAKRLKGDGRGRPVYREPLVWLARDPERLPATGPLPLIAFPPPSVTRAIALRALEKSGVSWRIVCTCGSLSGLTAAARAGMGLLVQPRSMAPAGLSEVPPGLLPDLEDVEFVLVSGRDADPRLVEALSGDIIARIRGPGPSGY